MSIKPTNSINKEVFRAYDIRGKIGKEWCLDNNYHDAFLIGQAIGNQLVKRNSGNIIIGRDGRLSSHGLADKLIEGLLSTGCNVTDIGLVATPIIYFALTHLNIVNSVMVTGSHNPPDHNGIKIVYESTPLSSIVIETLYFDIVNGNSAALNETNRVNNTKGEYLLVKNISTDYQHTIANDIQLKRPLRIGVDCGNGATSLFSESLFSLLGCEVSPLFDELDGTFPNHSPDPTVPENLTFLINLVKDKNLDIGIAFDGDGDRMIAVDNKGTILWPDRIMLILAKDILRKYPRSAIVFDVKCSFLLPKAIREFGGQPSMSVSGHSLVKMQMKRLNAVMGGEFSGHIILADRWSYFDDAPYVAARLLELLSNTDQPTNTIFEEIAASYCTPEYKLNFDHPEEANILLEQFIQHADFSGADLSLIDGIRVDYDDCWGLIRSSNTTASLTFRFEALTLKGLDKIQNQFKRVLEQTENQQKLPF